MITGFPGGFSFLHEDGIIPDRGKSRRQNVSIHYGWIVAGTGFAAAAFAGGAILPPLFLPKAQTS